MTDTSTKALSVICESLDEEAKDAGFAQHKHANILRALSAERDDLKATNADLLEALKAWAEFDALPLDAKRPDIFEIKVLRKMRDAIAKAEGKP